MRTFATNLGTALHDIATSKKFLMGVMTLVVQALPVSADMKQHALEIGALVIAGQGLADFGKTKAQIQTQAVTAMSTVAPVADPR